MPSGPPVSMVSMPISGKASTAATKAPIRASRRRSTMLISNLLHFRTAQQAGGAEDQHHDQDAENGDILVFDAEIRRPEGFDQADQQTAQHGARQTADAAQH